MIGNTSENKNGSTSSMFVVVKSKNNLTLVTDPRSPYFSAPPQIQALFQAQPTNPKNIKIVGSLQELEPMVCHGSICTRIFPSGSFYYTCQECCLQNTGSTMCYCEGCFEPEMHVGHNVRKGTSSGSAYCDCGRQKRIKPETFCKAHYQKYQGIESVMEIPAQIQQQFIPYFESLFLCYFYLRINNSQNNVQVTLQRLINASLYKLCSNSRIYTSMITKIMKKIIVVQNSNVQYMRSAQIMEQVLFYMSNSQHMLFAMTCDPNFKFQLVKAILNMKKHNWSVFNFRILDREELYDNDDILLKLGAEGHFIPQKIEVYLQLAQKSKQGFDIFKKLIEIKRSKQNSQDFINFILQFAPKKYTILIRKQLILYLLEMVIKFPYSYIGIVRNMGLDKKISLVALTSMLLFSLVEGNLKRLSEINQTNCQGIKDFLCFCCDNIQGLVMKSRDKFQGWLAVIVALMAYTDNQDHILENLWRRITEADVEVREDFTQILTAIYQLTAITINYQQYFHQVKAVQEQIQTQCKLQGPAWLKQYLYQHQQVHRKQLLVLKQKGFLNFAQSNRIVRQVCSYNQQSSTFQYRSPEIHRNYLMRFNPKRSSMDLRNISCRNWTINDHLELKQYHTKDVTSPPPVVNTLLRYIFKGKFMVENLWNRWDKKREETIGYWKNQNIGLYFVFTFIYAYVLSNSTNQHLSSSLNKFKNDPSLLEILYASTSDQSKINELLDIPIELSPIKSNKNISSPSKDDSQSKKKIFQDKKQRLKQKYQSISSKFSTESTDQQEQNPEQETCIICKQPTQPLFHLCNYAKHTSPTCNLYGQYTSNQARISGCLHMIHFGCFSGIAKSNFDFNCPLCSRKNNICLPLVDVLDPGAFRKAANYINALEVVKFQNMDWSGLFGGCVRHLVGSILDWIVYMGCLGDEYKSQLDRNKNMNRLIFNTAIITGKNMSKQEIQQQLKDIILFSKSTSIQTQCLNQVQSELSKIFCKMISHKQTTTIDKQCLYKIAKLISKNDFCNMVKLLSDFGECGLDIDEKEYGKVYLSFNLDDIPDRITNFPITTSCLHCNQPSKVLCLLCKCELCYEHLSSQSHTLLHNSTILTLHTSQKTIQIKQKNGIVNGTHQIYFDGFMSPYSAKDPLKSANEEYLIEGRKIRKIVRGFLLRN